MGERRVESIFCMYIGEINNNPMRSSCHLIITCFRDLERLVRSPNCLRIFPFSRLRQRADGVTGQQRMPYPPLHAPIIPLFF